MDLTHASCHVHAHACACTPYGYAHRAIQNDNIQSQRARAALWIHSGRWSALSFVPRLHRNIMEWETLWLWVLDGVCGGWL